MFYGEELIFVLIIIIIFFFFIFNELYYSDDLSAEPIVVDTGLDFKEIRLKIFMEKRFFFLSLVIL